MGQLVRIVVSCSDRKSTEVASDLRLAAYPDNLEERATRWIDRLNRPGGKIVPANQLYQGEHWSVVQKLTSTAAASGCQVELWVASAGYGLVRADDSLEPYAATFATRNADSITRPGSNSSPGADAAFWWRRMSERPRTVGRPCNLQELAGQQPESPMIVALSASYARAVGRDLLAAAHALADQSQLFLVSSETAGSGLGQFRVPTSARFQQSLGGTLMSLNARVANHIVELAPPTIGTESGSGYVLRTNSRCSMSANGTTAIRSLMIRYWTSSRLRLPHPDRCLSHDCCANSVTTTMPASRSGLAASTSKRWQQVWHDQRQPHHRP